MDPLRVAIRCAATFVFLLAMLRMSGKKVVSQSETFDFVLALIMGDLVDDFLFSEVPASAFVIAVATLVVADLMVKFIGYRSEWFDLLVSGRPAVLLRDGEPDRRSMQSELMNESNLLALLRLQGFDEQTKNDVTIATLEQSGELSTLRKMASQAVQKKEKEALQGRKE